MNQRKTDARVGEAMNSSPQPTAHEDKLILNDVDTSGMKPLPSNFKPSDNDVICARGKEVYNHEGNRRFRELVKSNLQLYSKCATKMQKSRLVNYIVGTVRQGSPTGGFVKRVGKKWYCVSDRHAREKAGQTMRDLLHSRYSSSTKAKARTRQKIRAARRAEESSGFDDMATQTRLARAESQRLPSPNLIRQPLKIHRSQSSPVRPTSLIGDCGRNKLVEEMISSISTPIPSLQYAQSIATLPVVSPSSFRILRSSQQESTLMSTNDPFDDAPSEDFSLTVSDLDDLEPLPVEQSSCEFDFDRSSTTRVSDSSFSQAVDTLFECLHISGKGSPLMR